MIGERLSQRSSGGKRLLLTSKKPIVATVSQQLVEVVEMSVTDNFFCFWFSFVFTNLSDLESGDAEGVYQYAVEPQMNDFASPAFEAICREFIRAKNRKGELPFRVSKLGRWWGKLNQSVPTESGKPKLTAVDTEIDIVAMEPMGNL